MLQRQMSIHEVAKDCARFGGADGNKLLHLCFDHRTDYDPDVVFDKKYYFLRFLLKMLPFLLNVPIFIHTCIQMLIKKILKIE